jgi:oligopeptidase B
MALSPPPGIRPPSAPRRPHRLEAHGDVRVDDWYWLRERDDPDVAAYLKAENEYTAAVLQPTAGLQDRLYEAIRARVQEDDVSAPARRRQWWYWTRTYEGRQYAAHWRLADPDRRLDAAGALAAARSGHGELVLDENELAGDHDYFALGVLDISPDQGVVAYAHDYDGSELYTLRFRDLVTGSDRPDVIEGVYYGSAWATGRPDFFYVRPDGAMRPFQVWRHRLGTPAAGDALVYQEDDERFFVSVGLTRSERFVIVHSESKMTSEVRFVDASTPEVPPQVIAARRQGVEYDVEHAVVPGEGDVWLVRSNAGGPGGEPATNFAVEWRRVGGGASGTVLAHRPEVKVESVDAFASHLVVAERAGGLERLRVIAVSEVGRPPTPDPGDVIAQPEPVYTLTGGRNADWDTTVVRFGYTSLVTPMSSVDYDVATGERRVVKVQPVLGGYDPAALITERIWATADDGTRVPISLVRRRDQPDDGSGPCLLYGYGAYEITIDPAFSPARLNLLERGVTFAIAHVRGGGEMGRRWYEEGRLDRKPHTFSDFIACAEHLVAAGYTSPGRLAIRGGSAGGLLMGAVTNMRPDLFAAVVAEVPFVDVVTTMSDDTLPLTVTEWEEWGNPAGDAGAYRTILSYSPYDNVRPAAYPSMYVTAGLNDPRVGYWEPAKWVAKLRATRTDDRPLLLKTEMGAGHQGPSGRYEAWKDEARVQAFVLAVLGVED